MLSARSEASEILTDQSPAKPANALPQQPRSASAGARKGGLRTAPAALSFRMTGWGRMLVSLLCASCWSRQAC